jgi:acetate kinase
MTAEILVINAGSSSIKVSLFKRNAGEPTLLMNGLVEGLGTDRPHAVAKDAHKTVLFNQTWPAGQGPADHGQAMALVVEKLTENRPDWKPSGIGHRIVHGGMKYAQPTVIDAECQAFLTELVGMAPLHIPGNLKGIEAATRAFPGVPQIACFDTSFHHGRSFVSQTYGLPREYFDQGVRRYGFHGLSYEYIVHAMRKLAPDVAKGRMIVAHLGNGASMTAIHDGRSIETTMGYTAVDGLPMGTRCGQLDPGVILAMLIQRKLNPMQVLDITHKQSGLLGISGISSDMRDLLASTDPKARDAIDYFVHRIVYYVGALAAAMGGIDALVFTGGIGENAAPIRQMVCERLVWLGLELDAMANDTHQPRISKVDSKVSAWAVPTNEELMIAMHVAKLVG